MRIFKREKISFLFSGNSDVRRSFSLEWISSNSDWNSFRIICFLIFSCRRLFSWFFADASFDRENERARKIKDKRRQRRPPRERILCFFADSAIFTFGPYLRDLPLFYYAVFCLYRLIYKIEKDKEYVIVVFSVFKGPSCFNNKAVIRCWRGFLIRKKTGCRIRGEYTSEEKIGLLVRELIGKWNRLGKRDVDMALFWELGMEHFWTVLKESLFNVLGCWGKKKSEGRYERNNEVGHLKNNSTAKRKRKI